MRIVLQRVRSARVSVDNEIVGEIAQGLLLLVGITHNDNQPDIDWLIKKVIQLRIFNDDAGKMNLSVTDVAGEILVVSQFTLFADCKKGNRPSYTDSAPPNIAVPLYEQFLKTLATQFKGKIATGIFGANMQVELLNDGPVTIFLDSQNKG